jgi:hypothetical protein
MTAKGPGTPQSARRDRLIRESEHDPYRERGKHPEPASCPDCGAGYRAGRWQWVEGGPFGAEVRCPACRRIHDGYPAGHVTLSGPSVERRSEEMLALARHVEERERAEHPLKRIMDLHHGEGSVVITTTDMHLARSIGDALEHAFKGDLEYEYTKEGSLLRVRWEG